MREILKRKSEGDFVWMDEMRKTMWVFVVWDERERERERGDEINNKKRIKKYYLNRINGRIDKLMWVVLKSGYVKIEKVGS